MQDIQMALVLNENVILKLGDSKFNSEKTTKDLLGWQREIGSDRCFSQFSDQKFAVSKPGDTLAFSVELEGGSLSCFFTDPPSFWEAVKTITFHEPDHSIPGGFFSLLKRFGQSNSSMLISNLCSGKLANTSVRGQCVLHYADNSS